MENTRIETKRGVKRQAIKREDLDKMVNEGITFVREQLYILATTPNPIIDKHRQEILYSLSIPNEVA